MAFVEDNGMGSVELIKASKLNTLEHSIEEELVMANGYRSTV